MNTESNKFKAPVSNKLLDGFNLNEGLSTVGDTIKSIWGKPQTTIIQQTPIEKEKDNTMLYVGIGGAVVMVVLLIFMLK